MAEPRTLLYRSADELDFALGDLPRVPRPDRIVMIDPEHFDVAYALNPHQLDDEGHLKSVDRARARGQWEALRALFEELGLTVDVLEPVPGQLDLVFCANQVLPLPAAAEGPPRAVPSRMASAQRAPEVPHVVAFLRTLGYSIEPLQSQAKPLEGMGDGLWHTGRRLLWAGAGVRSCAEAWEEIAARYEVPTVLLELRDPSFYHLDTCLALLDEETCLWTPGAFDERGRGLIEALFPRRVEADPTEAREKLANNAFCPDGKHVVLQSGCERTNERLAEAGFEPLPTDTGEFLKSGGSVFCLKLFHGPLGAG